MPPLLKVRTDKVFTKARRSARSGERIDPEVWESEDHRAVIVGKLQEQWIDQYKRFYGIEYAGDPFEVHAVTFVDYSGDATYDSGPVPPPHPQHATPERLAAYERAERRRAESVRDVAPGPREFVDVKLITNWWVPSQGIIAKPSSLAGRR